VSLVLQLVELVIWRTDACVGIVRISSMQVVCCCLPSHADPREVPGDVVVSGLVHALYTPCSLQVVSLCVYLVLAI
jgi:hypothetical protein